MTATTFWSADGRPMSAAQFIESLFGELPRLFKDEDELRRLWSEPVVEHHGRFFDFEPMVFEPKPVQSTK